MKIWLLLVLAVFLSACQTNSSKYETPYPTASSTVFREPQVRQDQALVEKPTKNIYQFTEPQRLPPLQTGAPVAPPKGCVDLRARQGAC